MIGRFGVISKFKQRLIRVLYEILHRQTEFIESVELFGTTIFTEL